MEIPAEAWSAAVPARHARRAYDGRAIEPATLDALRAHCDVFRPFDGVRAAVVERPAVDVFSTGVARLYGSVTGAPSLLLFVGADGVEDVDVKVGYTGEAAVLEATRLGLGTCWVAIFGHGAAKRLPELAPGERPYAVSPLGYALPAPGRRTRKPLAEIAPGAADGGWPEWTVAAVEAARIAPSAMNRQPWEFRLEDGALVVSAAQGAALGVSRRLDCGIAMMNAEVAARAAGVGGTWELLHGGADVARWRPEGA